MKWTRCAQQPTYLTHGSQCTIISLTEVMFKHFHEIFNLLFQVYLEILHVSACMRACICDNPDQPQCADMHFLFLSFRACR